MCVLRVPSLNVPAAGAALAGVSSLRPAPRTPSSKERNGENLKPPDQAKFPALVLQLLVRLGTVQSEASEGVEPTDVW